MTSKSPVYRKNQHLGSWSQLEQILNVLSTCNIICLLSKHQLDERGHIFIDWNLTQNIYWRWPSYNRDKYKIHRLKYIGIITYSLDHYPKFILFFQMPPKFQIHQSTTIILKLILFQSFKIIKVPQDSNTIILFNREVIWHMAYLPCRSSIKIKGVNDYVCDKILKTPKEFWWFWNSRTFLKKSRILREKENFPII